MNYCRKCQSDYDRPGTCNCFAPAAAPQPIQVQPWAPIPGTTTVPVPTYPSPYWRVDTLTPRYLSPFCVSANSVTTDTIRADQLPAGTHVTYTS